ncbi:aldehyde dehydrogenase [Shewanella sp. OPT22]|nr:aldehyde dehydrogenase [Shewanella sp. OPT22]
MSEVQKTISPIDGSIFVERKLATREGIEHSVNVANNALSEWQQLSINQRKQLCAQAVEIFVSLSDEIAKEITWQMGRPISQSADEIKGFAFRANYMLDIAESALSPVCPEEKLGVERYIEKVPVGVIVIIAPWNYPLLTAVNTLIPALVAGNAVILKHSPQTPLCAERIVEACHLAGIPKAIIQYLHLNEAGVEYLVKETAIHHVAFTGSVKGGSAIEKAAAGRFLGTGFELGGKDAAYICDDADIELAVESIVSGAYYNSGQSCCSIERLYVPANIYNKVLEQAIDLINHYQLGRPDDLNTNLGPLVCTRSADFVRAQINQAIAKGAVTHIDVSKFESNKNGTPYLAPQLLSQVDHSMDIMTEETFGPVLGIQKVSDDADAIKLINDNQYGLTASVFTSDFHRAKRIGKQLMTGSVYVNKCDYLDPALAWTGVKNSGHGCSLSILGYNAVTRPKSFYINRGK